MATLSPFERARVSLLLEQYCSNRTVRLDTHRLRYSFAIRGVFVTLIEERKSSYDKKEWIRIPIAQFRRNASSTLWTLYCRDLGRSWHLFEDMPGSRRLEFLLQVVEKDQTGIFFG